MQDGIRFCDACGVTVPKGVGLWHMPGFQKTLCWDCLPPESKEHADPFEDRMQWTFEDVNRDFWSRVMALNSPIDEFESEGVKAGPVRHFFTKVVGVTHPNKDGSDRQAIIGRCRRLESLELDHEDDNPYDPNAVAACRLNGEQIGYLSRELASEIVCNSNKGNVYAAFVANITGGTDGCRTRGVNVLIIVGDPGVTADLMQAYCDSIAPEIMADE